MRSQKELGVSGDKILGGFVSCTDFGFNPGKGGSQRPLACAARRAECPFPAMALHHGQSWGNIGTHLGA